MEDITRLARGLEPAHIEQFITDGFVRIDHAFPRALADAARAILWKATGCDPDDPATWTRPVIRLGMFTQPPFVEAANTPRLHAAFDQLVGPGRWRRPAAMGTSLCGSRPRRSGRRRLAHRRQLRHGQADFLSWRANIHSKGRALLMLFLFSDVGERDAPTRIRVGSHKDVARQLAPAGDAGLTLRELAADAFETSAASPCRHRNGRSRHGVPVSPVPGACGATAPRRASAIPGAAAVVARGSGQSASRGTQHGGTGNSTCPRTAALNGWNPAPSARRV